VARLVPGTRAITFLSAGVQRVPFYRFVIFDALGAAIWVPLILVVGAQVGQEIGGIERLFSRVANFVWVLILLATVLAVAWRFFRTEESKL
jgi:membrane protein DedA with SNARE-associated domain